MCKECNNHSSEKKLLSRRDFMKKAMKYGASGALLFMIDKPSLFAAGLDAISSNGEYGRNNCYKLVFNALNATASHFAPPDGETISGEKFEEVFTMFKAFLGYPYNQSLVEDKFPDFAEDYDRYRRLDPDILAMVFSCLGGDEEMKSIQEVFTTFRSLYPDFTQLEEADIQNILDGFFIAFSMVKKQQLNGTSMYSLYPFIFGMGDTNYIGIISILFGHAENNPDWAEGFWNNMEAFMFRPAGASMVFQSWTPPKYRIIPSQSSSSIPGTELFQQYISTRLHDFDKLENYIANNQLASYAAFNCGCMIQKMQRERLPEEAEDVLYNYFYDVSMRQTPPDGNSPFKSISDGFYNVTADAEDHNLAKQVFNYKADADYPEPFMCNCHESWCIQLRPRNMFWGEQVANEPEGTRIEVIQKACYRVELTSPDACAGCQACCTTETLENVNYDIKDLFKCPAHAITSTGNGISIDHDRCLGCLLCVRNCFRTRNSTDIALSVAKEEVNDAIPATFSDLMVRRQEMSTKYRWTSFEYSV